MGTLCISTTDFLGQTVVLTERCRQEKSVKHPELNDSDFIDLIRKAIARPHFVYEDFALPKRRWIYYLKKARASSPNRYTKVVILIVGSRMVITAYEVDFVKEHHKKCKLIHGRYV